jgi:hypothetical protein
VHQTMGNFLGRCTNPGVFTDATADTTDGSADITVDDGTAFEVGDLISGAGIPSGSSITAVSTNTITISANATATATNITVTVTPTESRQDWWRSPQPDTRPQEMLSFVLPTEVTTMESIPITDSVTTQVDLLLFSRTAHFSLDNFGANLIGCQSGDKGIFYWEGDVGTAGGSPTLAEEITTANGYTETAPSAVAILVTQERHVLALGAAGDLRQINGRHRKPWMSGPHLQPTRQGI